MENYKKYQKLFYKYSNSISFEAGYFQENEDIYQELVFVFLKLKEKFKKRPGTEGQFIKALETSFRRKKLDIIKKYENEKFKRQLYNQDILNKKYSHPSISSINLYYTLERIKKDINDHCLEKDRTGRYWRIHQAEEYHYILNSMLAGVEREEIKNHMRMGDVTFKKRWLFIRKLFKKYYEVELKNIFAHFDKKTLTKIRQMLKVKSIDNVAREVGCARSAIACYVTELNRTGYKRNWNDRGQRPMKNEILALIKSAKNFQSYAYLAGEIKNKMEELFGYKDTFGRYYHVILRNRHLCPKKAQK